MCLDEWAVSGINWVIIEFSESKQKKESDKKSEVETVRSNVRRMMKDILVER
jgi:hypothetical protein